MKYQHKTDTGNINYFVDLINAAYRGHDGNKRWTTEYGLIDGKRIRSDALTALINDHQNDFIIGLQKGLHNGLHYDKPVACINIHYQDGIAEFGCFAVDPDYHAEGSGTQLLAYAEQVASSNANVFQVIVVSKNLPLINYYERRGYQRNGASYPYPIHANVGKPRSDDLEMVVLQKSVV